MFGNFLNKQMLSKMEGMKQQIEEIKSKLDKISVIGESDNGACRVIASGNRTIKEIQMNDAFMQNATKTEIENAMLQASNRALEQATRVEQSEMSHAAMGMLPGLG